MKINIRRNGGEVVVALNGELDTVTTAQMGEELNRIIEMASNQLIIDCKDLEYISSSGLRFFMQLKRHSEQLNGTVTLINMNQHVKEVFRISGFHHIFNIQ
jgi:anti-sigma B factor antagonist